ncbi:MAG: cellulase family glycosylhydrolase [Deltaproteobacteria bacterium]|nr:cellulase family glycosylhydrolase [Deltaproteobacteria bacterium]
MKRWLAMLAVLSIGLPACIDGDPPSTDPRPLTRLKTDRTYLRDAYGRYVFFHGVNLSGSTKVPAALSPEGIPSYLGKPFDLEEADRNFALIRDLGFDTVRLLIIWEGIEPTARGVYDTEYLEYIEAVVEKADEYGIYVLLDMHQDMFSRHLMVRYNHHPRYGEPGSLENSLLALVPDMSTGEYDDTVQGDGAPRWAVEACLQEKKLDSPHWGTPRIISGMNLDSLQNIFDLYQSLTGDEGDPSEAEWVGYFLASLPGPFPVDETSDLLPFTFWGISHMASLDVARCYGCMFAGDALYPELRVGGRSVQEHLQSAYTEAWAQVATRVGHLPNVLGYDLMNEPGGNFLVLTAIAGMIQAGAAEGALGVLVDLLGDEDGQRAYDALLALKLLPPDTEEETLERWGLAGLDILAALEMNINFDEHYMRPFYERVGMTIQAIDPDAVVFIETSLSAESLLGSGGIGGIWEDPMIRPEGIDQVVFAPHWYPDIYPMLGFNQPPRTFSIEEVRYRDYRPALEQAARPAQYSLGNLPVVFGEFGTYFNFNGIETARAQGYQVSAQILDNYYEAFEAMGMSRIQWCYSPENDHELGDLWNHEDFSVVGPDLEPRGWQAYSRPHARALAGKPISSHYYSPLHYFDPDAYEVPPVGEFELRYATKECSAPTEIVIPRGACLEDAPPGGICPDSVYPDGFYVWLSDGHCQFDPVRRILYHMPSLDQPGTEHRVRILGPLPGYEAVGWRYFFKGDRVLTR